MERTEATSAEPLGPARREVPVNEAAIARLLKGELDAGEADVAWHLIRRCKNWRAAYERAMQKHDQALELHRRSMP
ncbi:MAG: hypothetical protein PHX93_04870 [Candidatus Peribacteraceae bacterium]|nr:hypothetical protein [Candidatus Peribacteraceae bacterium]